MAYAKTPELAKKRVLIKRQLRKLNVKGWKNDDTLTKLQAKLRGAKKKKPAKKKKR